MNVAALPCAKGAEKCKDGLQCVYDWSCCDLYKDCKDGSDEDPDMCRGIVYCEIIYIRASPRHKVGSYIRWYQISNKMMISRWKKS